MKARRFIAVLLFVISFLAAVNIVRVNLSYRAPRRIEYGLNENVSLERGAEMKVISCSFMNTRKYEDYIKRNFPNEPAEDKKGVKAVMVRVRTNGKVPQSGDLKQMQLNSGNFENASAIEYNRTDGNTSTYVYEIPSTLMTKSHFRDAASLKYRLVVRCYPRQIFINLN